MVQPKPQALPRRNAGPSSIIVSPRQKGNPILNNIKSVPWEYGDIPADYVLGLTTCALFLSLKYHRLHPEYIYTRIRNLQGKYNLRIVLVMVDIGNHEESLKELSKTSLINNVTLILCWSSAEGGRYLELFKSYENAQPTSIRQHQSTAYADRMVDFITTPRSINKTDAVALVSQFGSVRTAVNAREEDVAGIAGWGEKKVKQWCGVVREPFRIQRTAKRTGAGGGQSLPISLSRGVTEAEREGSGSPAAASRQIPQGESPLRHGSTTPGGSRPGTSGLVDADKRPTSRLAETVTVDDEGLNMADEEEAFAQAMAGPPIPAPKRTAGNAETTSKKRRVDEDPLSGGVMAALSKLRKDGG